MSEIEPADLVRTHLALVTGEHVALYLGAAVARIALENGVSPRQVVQHMLDAGAFCGDGDEWEKERKALETFTRVTRNRLAAAGVQLYQLDPNRN